MCHCGESWQSHRVMPSRRGSVLRGAVHGGRLEPRSCDARIASACGSGTAKGVVGWSWWSGKRRGACPIPPGGSGRRNGGGAGAEA